MLVVAGKFDERRRSALVDKYFGRSRSRRARCRTIYTDRADAGRRARGDAAPRRRHADSCRRVYHVPAGVAPGLRRRRHRRRRFSATRRRAGCTRRWSRRRRRRSIGGFDFQWRDPTLAIFGAEVRKDDRRSTPRATRCCRPSKASRRRRPPKKKSSARARSCSKNIELTLNDSDRDRPDAERVDRRGRLAAVLPAPRPPAQGHARGRAARSRPRTSSRRTARSACSSRPSKPDRAEIPADAGRRRRCSRTTRATRRSPRARRSIRRRRTSSRAPSRSATPAGMKLALLPKKTRGGTVVAAAGAALRRREEPDEPRRPRLRSPARC